MLRPPRCRTVESDSSLIVVESDWVYNDVAPWDYHALPAALGCQDWFTAKVSTLVELDAALARASTAHRRAISRSSRNLDAMYAHS